jgi:hypothetical protein
MGTTSSVGWAGTTASTEWLAMTSSSATTAKMPLAGGGGSDRIHGGPVGDSIFGGTQDDVLRGGRGDDHLNDQLAELESLIAALHKTVQRSLPVTLVGVGLPQIPRLAGEAKSYAERLFKFPAIGSLPGEEAMRP